LDLGTLILWAQWKMVGSAGADEKMLNLKAEIRIPNLIEAQ
jgi:hypothetical protein